MTYTEKQVLDMLKKVSDCPNKILDEYNTDMSNITLDETHASMCKNFVYTFPIIIDNEEIGNITLLACYANDNYDNMEKLMHKYLGYEDYKKSYKTNYSYNSNTRCYMILHKEQQLPEQSFTVKDADNNEFTFKISYDESTNYKLKEYADKYNIIYTFNDREESILLLDYKIINGWELGSKINENIKIRLRDHKLHKIINDNE